MKKIVFFLITTASLLFFTINTSAREIEDTIDLSNPATTGIDRVFGKITPPPQIQPLTNLGGAGGLSFFLSRVIELLYTFAILAFVFMIIISAIQWILSGGDKEAVGKARSRLIYAIIGIILLALAFVFLRVLGQITGFSFFQGG